MLASRSLCLVYAMSFSRCQSPQCNEDDEGHLSDLDEEYDVKYALKTPEKASYMDVISSNVLKPGDMSAPEDLFEGSACCAQPPSSPPPPASTAVKGRRARGEPKTKKAHVSEAAGDSGGKILTNKQKTAKVNSMFKSLTDTNGCLTEKYIKFYTDHCIGDINHRHDLHFRTLLHQIIP